MQRGLLFVDPPLYGGSYAPRRPPGEDEIGPEPRSNNQALFQMGHDDPRRSRAVRWSPPASHLIGAAKHTTKLVPILVGEGACEMSELIRPLVRQSIHTASIARW
jgi:hypothetical protein